MNKSIFSKNQNTTNLKGNYSNRILFSDLSATSTDFMSQIMPKMRGGSSCPCTKCLEAFNEGNVELALYILNEGNCCCKCKDNNGNTILHNLIICANSSDVDRKYRDQCKKAIDKLINSSTIGDCINIQNNDGVTPILLAVMNGDESTAEKLDNRGADKSIKDKNGNYIREENDSSVNSETINSDIRNIARQVSMGMSDRNDGTSLDLGSLRRDTSDSVPVYRENPMKKMESALDEYGRMLIEKSKVMGVHDRTLGDNTDDMLFAEVVSAQPAANDEIKFLNPESANKVIKLMKELDADMNSGNTTNAAKPAVKPTEPAFSETSEIPVSKQSGVMESDTDKFLSGLKQSYEDKANAESSQFIKPTPTASKVSTGAPTGAPSDAPIDTEVDTDALMQAISRISAKKSEPEPEKQTGGKSLEKIMGYRNVIENSDDMSSIASYTSNDDKEYSLNSDYADLYYDEKEGGATNELSRMMQSQKDKIHEQVLDMIMSMLNKGELVKDSEPIKADERNAKLIKAYIYRQVSEKNPQLGGLDKILMISKMSDSQIIDMVNEMPSLDEIERNIQKHLEEKRANKPEKKEKKEKKPKTEESDTLADLTISETTETTESETPKKKKATKSATKATKTTKAKKTSKK